MGLYFRPIARPFADAKGLGSQSSMAVDRNPGRKTARDIGDKPGYNRNLSSPGCVYRNS